jgi:hypothetical protein
MITDKGSCHALKCAHIHTHTHTHTDERIAQSYKLFMPKTETFYKISLFNISNIKVNVCEIVISLKTYFYQENTCAFLSESNNMNCVVYGNKRTTFAAL